MVIGEHNVKNREDDDDDYDDDDVDDEVDVDALCMSECDHHISSRDTTALSSVPSHIHNKTQLYTSIRIIHNNTHQYTATHGTTQLYTTIHNYIHGNTQGTHTRI